MTFEDMNIFLSAILIFCGLTLLLVAEISEQPRNIFANISGLRVLVHNLRAQSAIGNNERYQRVSVQPEPSVTHPTHPGKYI